MNEIHAKLDQVFRRSYRVNPALPAAREPITGDPILPPELEREIFELAAAIPYYWTDQHVGDMALVLPQVCRRAQSWIEPLIYERISFLADTSTKDPTPLFLRTIDTRPASFFAENVKYLYFDKSLSLHFIHRVLSVCVGVISLGCHQSYNGLAPFLAPLPLQRLLLSDMELSTNFSPPWVSSLTHLGLSVALPHDPLAVFGALPALTHLAFEFDALPSPSLNTLTGTVSRILLACPHLRCLVLTISRANYRLTSHRLREEKFSNPRFYVLIRYITGGWYRRRRVTDLFVEANARLKIEAEFISIP
ncbi:hypothetical protein K438DRAFT_1991882 [Mycena galopus ATCC 62051]|nr:hypothetical protein K438DRAFT_1991882 [Mycena galopus ATCC 62051]